MNTLAKIYWTARGIGPENVLRRCWHVLQGKLGIHRLRTPAGELPTEHFRRQFVETYQPADDPIHWRKRVSRFFVDPERLADMTPALRTVVDDECWRSCVTDVTKNLQQGRMRFFSRFFADVGWPVAFNRDAVNHVDWPTGQHWSTYAQFDLNLSDMKCVWEPSRFSTAYLLARDFARTRHPAGARLFWQMVEAWHRQNPYGLTVQWACGQESSFRAMAWLFAAAVLLADPGARADRLHDLTELIWYTGRHVDRNINYARSQKNNHAISEAVVLWTIGLLFPEFRDAPRWRKKGRTILAAEVSRQIYDDGSYIQHSLNYHRLMMDDLLWALRLAELNDTPLPAVVTDRLERSLAWLLEMIDPTTGRVPNYGANDGALVLPLSCCDYLDFRPVAQAASYLLYRRRCFEPGPWDEKALWLFGPEVRNAPSKPLDKQASFSAPIGGYFILRGPHTCAMTRCHTYHDRPSQADMLHLDLWLGGENILRDAGTYHYYCDEPWQRYFLCTAAHNTIEIDGVDQMIKGPRFLWFRWIRSHARRFATSDDGRVGYFEGEHYGYMRLPGKVIHRRSLCRMNDTYIILDDVLGSGSHEVCLRWRLHPSEWRRDGDVWLADIHGEPVGIKLALPEGFSHHLANGAEGAAPEGWESLYYGEKTPVPTLIIAKHAVLPLRIATIVGPANEVSTITASHTVYEPDAPAMLSGVGDAGLTTAVRELSDGRILVE